MDDGAVDVSIAEDDVGESVDIELDVIGVEEEAWANAPAVISATMAAPVTIRFIYSSS
jgi:hypothetical protein